MLLTEKAAFEAMRRLLEEWWEITGRGDEIGLLLSAMDGSLTSDGLPIDRAVWASWLRYCGELAES
jgi:hypothetical protein